MKKRDVVQKQHEIVTPTKLLDERGYVAEPGWCRHNLYQYSRKDVTANKYRIKEWDFYQVTDGRYLIQMTIANITLGEAVCITVADMLDKGKLLLFTGNIHLLTANSYPMPESNEEDSLLTRKLVFGTGSASCETTKDARHWKASGRALFPVGKKFDLDLVLDQSSHPENMTIAIPWKKKDAKGSKKLKDHFFLTCKQNTMPVTGSVRIGGKVLTFTPDSAIGVLDWGRGVWAHNIKWVWGNGGGFLPDGKYFGMELTWGFGDDSDATETAIFYDGKAHKLGRVEIEYDPKDQVGTPWKFHEENGRFEMTFEPYYNNHSAFDLGFAGSKTDQVHGYITGTATLDDGTVIPVDHIYMFCEHVHNKW